MVGLWWIAEYNKKVKELRRKIAEYNKKVKEGRQWIAEYNKSWMVEILSRVRKIENSYYTDEKMALTRNTSVQYDAMIPDKKIHAHRLIISWDDNSPCEREFVQPLLRSRCTHGGHDH